MIRNVYLTYLLLSLPCLLVAQKIDSLEAVLDTARNERKVKTLNELFRAHIQTDPVSAVGYTREALNIATEIGDQKGLAASYNNLGVAYRNQGAFDKALNYYINSLKLYEALNNNEGIATTKNNIATIYAMKKDYGQAMKYLEESYNLFLVQKDHAHIIGSLNNLGNLYSEIQLFEKALNYYSQAYQLSEKKGEKFADPLTNIGNIYFKQQNYQRAVEHYEKALLIERQSNNNLGILNIITNLGITFTKAKQAKPAQQYLDQAISLSERLRAYSFLPAVYKALAENYASQQKFKEAYDAQLKYDEIREKIYGEESSKNIAQMEMLLNFQETEKKYELLQHTDEIKTLELHRSRLFIVSVMLTVLIVLGLLNYYYLSKKKTFRKAHERIRQQQSSS